MLKIEELRKDIQKARHQRHPVKHPGDFLHVMKEYWPLGQYMLKKFGWRSWYSFWYTKLFVSDEGGEYAFKNPIYKKFPGFLRRPFKLEMEHTTFCDKKCIFCEHTHWSEKATKITFEQFKGVVEPIKSLKWMNITGEGSSFLNKDFAKIIEYLRNRHINVNFVDEFDFFDESISRKVIELGVNSIWVSFDGATKETYEKIKVGCNYDNALNNIRTLLRLKGEVGSPFPIINIRFIITTLNYQEMPAFIELVSSLKNRGVRARVEFVGLLTFAEIKDYYIPLDKIPESILIETFQKALEHNINLYFSHASACSPSMNRCAAWVEPYILIGGEIISCCAIIMSNNRKFLRENSFGNVHEKPFLEIWNSEKYKNFRKLVNTKDGKVPKSCYGCRAYDTNERAEKYGVMD